MAKYIVTHGIEIATEFVPEVFGRLTTQGPAFKLKTVCPSRIHRIPHQVVKCSCGDGTFTVVCRFSLVSGHTKSCGCHRDEQLDKHRTTHGMRHDPHYSVHRGMVERCTDPNNKRYAYYGGRGIGVYHEWFGVGGFERWYAYMGPRPSAKHSIDRYPNRDGNYEPGNVRWATSEEQNNNKRNNVSLTLMGKTMTITEWAKELGFKAQTLHTRHKAGWDTERMLTEKPRPSHNKSRRKKSPDPKI